MLMASMFLEMSVFFFLYESCPTCLLSMNFILAYWACSSAINLVLGLSFIMLTGEMDPAKKRRAAVINALALIILLALIYHAISVTYH